MPVVDGLRLLRFAASHTRSTFPCAQVNGKVTSGPDLSVEVNGLKLPNPFVIGSGPPGAPLITR